MPKSVEIKMTIPFAYYEEHGPVLYFTVYLPRTPEAGMVVPGEQMSVRLWADDDCIEHVPCYRETEAGRINIEMTVKQVRALVEGISVSDEMGDLILKLSTENNWVHEHLHSAYDQALLAEHWRLIRAAYLCAMEGCNTLIAHCRALKGQYWINSLRTDTSNLHSELLRLGARVRVDNSEWVRCACSGGGIFRGWSPGRQRCISEADWATMRSAVAAGRRPALVGTLLTIAEELEDQRHYRASLIEAVSALEIAVTQFVSKSDSADWFYKDKERFGVESIEEHRKHLGFTATVSYLFPMIFTDEQVPTATLMDCREAIAERNNVVHSGQRSVNPEKLERYLKSMRQLCEFLVSKCKKE
jgi:hypothetical protein